MKKTLKTIGWVLLTGVLLIVVGVVCFGGPLIKQAVNRVGPRVLGVPVTLQAATFAP